MLAGISDLDTHLDTRHEEEEEEEEEGEKSLSYCWLN
jgi:hypothetical protein